MYIVKHVIILNIVSLYIARLIPVGRRGIFYLFKLFLSAFAAPKGGGGSAPCGDVRRQVDKPVSLFEYLQ